MAVTTSLIGKIDLPPGQIGQPSQPLDLLSGIVDVTLGAAADYAATGLPLTTALAALGVNTLVSCVLISIRTAAGAWKQALGGATTLVSVTLDTFTSATPNLRIFVAPTAGGTYVEAAAAQFVNGDIVRLKVTGI